MKTITLILSIVLLVAFFGCKEDKAGPVEPTGPPPPTFSIASVTITDAGIQYVCYAATPSVDILLGRVEITPPIGGTEVYTGNNQHFLGGYAIALDCYIKVSGTWNFRFVGQHYPGQEPFDVRQTLNVAAKPLPLTK